VTVPYPPFIDPIAQTSQQVRYTYWPVNFASGDLAVISNVPLPLSGVKFSQVMRGVGELRATLQLADPEVRAMNPWATIIPRKTGVVVVRSHHDDAADQWMHVPQQAYIIWAAPRDPATGRMTITAQSVESSWARRLITRAMDWANEDQLNIAADLLDPALFSLIGPGTAPWPGWITVDPPTVPTGVLRTHSYAERQETNLLEAHQSRSQLSTGSYEWTTGVRVLVGADAVSASSFRPQYVMSYPRLGRELADAFPIPRLRYDTNGTGNVRTFQYAYEGSDVPNIVWGRGLGYEELQTKTLVTNTDPSGNDEWDYGYLQTEQRFSDPDVKLESTLKDYCYRHMWDRLGSEQFVSSLTLRGNVTPTFDTYAIGDEVVVETNDLTWAPERYDSGGFVSLLARIYGWTVTPPEGDQDETIELLVSGGELSA
jgi:hypothetical protein